MAVADPATPQPLVLAKGSCSELCNLSQCSHQGSTSPTCFRDLPEIRKALSAAFRQEKLAVNLESSTPFSRDHVWVRSQALGSGAFGAVYRCRRRDRDRYEYAVKEMNIAASGDVNTLQHVVSEVEVMRELSNSEMCHVVELAAFHHTDDTAWIVLRLLPGTPVAAMIKSVQRLPEVDRVGIVLRMATELLEMLAVSHARGIAHGDIKPDNVFIDLENCQRMTYVLDWGLAVKHIPGSKVVILKGTLEYLAPEVVAGWIAKSQGKEAEPVDPAAADIWSVGCLLLELLTAHSPFKVGWWRVATAQQCTGIHKLQRQWAAREASARKLQKLITLLPTSLQSFLHGLLAFNPKERLTAAQALHHPCMEATKGRPA